MKKLAKKQSGGAKPEKPISKSNSTQIPNIKKSGATKKYQTGGSAALKKAISDSTEADKHYFYAKQNSRNLNNPEGRKYIHELQAKMEAPGKIRKQIAKTKKK